MGERSEQAATGNAIVPVEVIEERFDDQPIEFVKVRRGDGIDLP